MEKTCPRCKNTFECRNDNILECDCILIPLNAEERAYIGSKYSGCLCTKCLVALKEERQRELAVIPTQQVYI